MGGSRRSGEIVSRSFRAAVAATWLGVFVAGCSSDEPEAVPVPTQTQTPTPTPTQTMAPTPETAATAVPTPAPEATAPPAATLTAEPTATNTPPVNPCPTGTPCFPGQFRVCFEAATLPPDTCPCSTCQPCPPPECGEDEIPVCEGVGAVNSCAGVCECRAVEAAPTPTPTSDADAATPTPSPTASLEPTPTAEPDPLDPRIREVIEFAAEICPPPGNVGPLTTVTCGARHCEFDCSYFSGHWGTAALARFPTSADAAAAFDAVDRPRSSFRGLPASFWVGPFAYEGIPGSSSHHGIFLAGCWLATASAYDDTPHLLAPQPDASLGRIHQRASELSLFDDCEP